MLIPRCKFLVVLEINQLSKFPHSSGKLMVKWHIADSARAETRGRTAEIEVEEHQANFKYRQEFTYYLGFGMNKQLHSGNIEFEAVWHPLSGRNRITVGTLRLDIAQFVGRESESMVFLLDNAKANILLSVKFDVHQLKGPTNYHPPPFTAPVMNGKLTTFDTDKSDKRRAHPDVMKSLVSKRVYLNYVQQFRQSSSHVNPMQTVKDIASGGDGFCGIKAPARPQNELVVDAIADGRKPSRPITEDELRENFVSWLYRVA